MSISYHQRLLERFRKQEIFARDYSPLYAAIFGRVAEWLAADTAGQDPLVKWLIYTGQERQTLDVTLLLAAGLHKDILAHEPGTANLAGYFPSVGGRRDPADTEFDTILRQTIDGRRESLAAFIQTANVQTNETGRGLCWLLPLQCISWEQVYLVDLGASAGLNLVANKRAYRLMDESSGAVLLDVGWASPVQFVARCRGHLAPLAALQGQSLPEIKGRIGCDLRPFSLDTPEAEQTLMAYVWGDQVARLERLREGIAAFREVQTGQSPVRLYPSNLPDELGAFLEARVPADDVPVVVYNTFMTTYLSDKGTSFGETIGRWAAGQSRPVLWLQWEPSRNLSEGPEYGWCGWTADLWEGSGHQGWFLGWVHPHGSAIQFESGFETFLTETRKDFRSTRDLPNL